MDSAENETKVFGLPPVLDINAAAELARELLALRGSPVQVDASQVERLGAQCLQILLSARATWDADGQPFSVIQPSEDFTTNLATLGASAEPCFQAQELSA